MEQATATARSWQKEGRRAVVARVIATRGLGPRADDELAVVDGAGAIGGSLLSGAIDGQLGAAARGLLAGSETPARVVELSISDVEADAAGLTCAGQVDVLLQPLDGVPGELWDLLASRQPVALAAALGTTPARAAVFLPGRRRVATLGDDTLDALAQAEADSLFTSPGTKHGRVQNDAADVVVEAWNPAPRVLVLGANALSAALTQQFALLGWSTTTATTSDDALAVIEAFVAGDVVIVLDHSPVVATPVLAGALQRGVGYVGALGSRKTQQARRTQLERAGVSPEQIERLHGPAGLDLGGRSPSETAVSIAAEIIATRSGRSAQALRSTTGSISG
jgi:xanthine dehydrogenase accessory factor